MSKNNTISILYIEDQPEISLFLSKILSRHYETIFLAENGKQGLELYIKHKPDIVISDIKMPVMDGLAMSAKIKEINPKAKIILTTAHNDMEYFMHSIDIGINQYILKPIDRDKLYKAIDSCIEQVMMEREIEKKTNDLILSNQKLLQQEKELRENLDKSLALKDIISKSAENFRQLAENIHDAFWLRTKNKVLYVNKAFENLFELPDSQLYDNCEIFHELIHSDDKAYFLGALKKHEKNKEGYLQEELKIVTPSGKQKYLWYRDLIVQSEESSDNRRVITVTDISRQKENEKLSQDLLVAKNSAWIRQQFLNNMSHEMRTPMNGIMAMTEILLQTPLNNNQTDYASTIKQSAENLLDLINDLLDINELSHEKIALNNQVIDTRDVFEKIISYFDSQVKEKKLYLKSTFEPEFPDYILTDRKRVSQVLKNLISNGLKYTNKGGVEIKLSHREIDEKNLEIRAEVSDTGVGISKAVQEKLFEVFTPNLAPVSGNLESMGTGLFLCRKVAELMHGRIQIESEPGKGSRFIFFFMAEKVTSFNETNSRKEITTVIPALNARVLYAEDKIVNQKVVSIILENAGCTVDIAENGLEALEKFQSNKYDLILMDIQMPVMDGITAVKELRSKYKKLPPVIGLSANAQKADAEQYIKEGLDDYLAKPIIPTMLYDKITEWLKTPQSSSDNQNKNKQFSSNGDSGKQTGDDFPDLDINIYQTIEEQTHGDKDIISDLYKSFLQEAEVILNDVENGIRLNDTELIRSSVHALKGLSSTIGAMAVYDISRSMDALNKQNKIADSIQLFESLKQKYLIVKQIIIDKLKLEV